MVCHTCARSLAARPERNRANAYMDGRTDGRRREREDERTARGGGGGDAGKTESALNLSVPSSLPPPSEFPLPLSFVSRWLARLGSSPCQSPLHCVDAFISAALASSLFDTGRGEKPLRVSEWGSSEPNIGRCKAIGSRSRSSDVGQRQRVFRRQPPSHERL